MNKRNGIIFDLDGTLLHTLEDLADSVNTVLARRGCPEHPVDAFREFVGDGMPMLVRRAVPPELDDEIVYREYLPEVREEYYRRWALKTSPYPGILEVLEALRNKGLPLAVLSNKPHESTLKTVEHFFPAEYFSVVQGALPDRAVKPDPELAWEISVQMGLEPSEIYLVGDSDVDIYTARSAGMISVGAAWGFRGRAELERAGATYILDYPEDLLNL